MEVRRDIQSHLVETPAAKETVLYSNTPSFLFERLRKDSSAAYIAHELGPQQIVALLSEKSVNPQTPLDLVWVYTLLAGLSLKGPEEVRGVSHALDRIDLSRVQWGDQLRAAVLNSGPRTNVVEITYKENKNSRSSTSSNVATGHIVNVGPRR